MTDFDRAREKAFGVGVKYDFGGTLLPFQIPGFSIHMLYVEGNDRINPYDERESAHDSRREPGLRLQRPRRQGALVPLSQRLRG